MKQSIGENIKIMRRKCGFTQDELALRLAVTPQAISKWENGNGTPDKSLFREICYANLCSDTMLETVTWTKLLPYW